MLVDASGAEKFRVSAPLAWDSAPDKAYSNALKLSVTQQSPGHWTLTMRPDAAWLNDPARVWPVSLDPDFYWLSDGSGAERFHGASQDCSLQGGNQATITFCAATALQVGYYNRAYKSNVRFDVQAAIPAYATATAAQFLAWQPPSTTKGPASSRLHTITTNWDNTATWNVSKTGTPWLTSGGGGDVSSDSALTGAPTNIGPSGYWSYWNAPLTAVNGWIKGTLPNYGFQLSTDPGSPPTTAYGFTSTDGDQASWPALDVTWVPDTTPPTSVAATGPGSPDQTFVNGTQSVSMTASASDENSGVKTFDLLVDGSVAATTAVSCPSNTCPLSASQALAFNPTGLTEAAHTLAIRATDAAGNATTSDPWTVYIDRTPPVWDSSSSASLAPINSSYSELEWDEAMDPALSDGTGPFVVTSYSYRYTPAGGTASAWQSVGDNTETAIPGAPSSVQLQVTATDEFGNVSAPKTFTVNMSAADPDDAVQPDLSDPNYTIPTPGNYDTTDAEDADPLGLDYVDEAAASTASARTAAATASYSGPLKTVDKNSYECTGRWATIQSSFSSFVTGNCKGGTIVRSHQRWTCSAQRCGTYPGGRTEGWSWNTVQFPSSVNYYDNCGWMNTKNRIEDPAPHSGSGPVFAACTSGPTYRLSKFIRTYARLGAAPNQQSAKYPGLWIWSGMQHGQEEGGIDYTPNWNNANKQCQVYANIEPFHGGIAAPATEKTWVIHNGSTHTQIRYISSHLAKNSAGQNDMWVNVRSTYKGTDGVGDSDEAWGFVDFNCLFAKTGNGDVS